MQTPKDGYSEQNQVNGLMLLLENAFEIKSKKPKEFSETISIGISGHMHGATLIDEKGGVIDLILWNDTRSHENVWNLKIKVLMYALSQAI